MAKTIEYYLSLASPWTYLGHQRLMQLGDRYGAKITPYPVDFSLIFPLTGGLPVNKRAPARQAYRLQELARWRDHLGIELNLQPAFFPVNDKPAAAIVGCLRDHEPLAALRFAGACLRAVWAEQRNIADKTTLIELLKENHLDEHLIGEIDSSRSQSRIKNDSEIAVEKGIFGAPSYFLPDTQQLFWGQDRLDFVARAMDQMP